MREIPEGTARLTGHWTQHCVSERFRVFRKWPSSLVQEVYKQQADNNSLRSCRHKISCIFHWASHEWSTKFSAKRQLTESERLELPRAYPSELLVVAKALIRAYIGNVVTVILILVRPIKSRAFVHVQVLAVSE
jgi:hypothetical protein